MKFFFLTSVLFSGICAYVIQITIIYLKGFASNTRSRKMVREGIVGFEQVRQGRISDNIVAQIKNAILSGLYRPGDKLPREIELRRAFNVSRVPLREALRSLEDMGLIKIKPGTLGGAFVAQMGFKSVSDSISNMMRLGKISSSEIMEFRILIEPNLSRLAAKRRTDWDIKQMEEMISTRDKVLKAGEIPIVSSIDFHQAIARAAKNPIAILVMDAIGEVFMEHFKKLSLSLKGHQRIMIFHRKIFDYIKNKDSEKSEHIMHVHLMDAQKILKI